MNQLDDWLMVNSMIYWLDLWLIECLIDFPNWLTVGDFLDLLNPKYQFPNEWLSLRIPWILL
jgi:hypothetical protein